MRIAIGISGGIDSAISAYLLQQQGHDVFAIFMQNWEQDSQYCTSGEDFLAAAEVCDFLDIPLTHVNFCKEYWDSVFSDFLADIRKGVTPNPDVLCNREIKFKAFLQHAQSLGADAIATGHYARIKKNNGICQLYKALDSTKDQSYFLHALTSEQLSFVVFPLAEFEKKQVRAMAQSIQLPNSLRKESMGICFIGDKRKYSDFLHQYIPKQQGDILDDTGKRIGTHKGCLFYTIGQRQGLDIPAISSSSQPYFVVAKDIQNNTLTVVNDTNHKLLYTSHVVVEAMHWIDANQDLQHILGTKLHAKTRHLQADQECEITQLDTQIHITFAQPQRAIALGQYAVIYQGERCLGGGKMSQTW